MGRRKDSFSGVFYPFLGPTLSGVCAESQGTARGMTAMVRKRSTSFHFYHSCLALPTPCELVYIMSSSTIHCRKHTMFFFPDYRGGEAAPLGSWAMWHKACDSLGAVLGSLVSSLKHYLSPLLKSFRMFHPSSEFCYMTAISFSWDGSVLRLKN